MEKERNGKNIVIGALLVTVLCVSVAVAAMTRELNVSGTVNLPNAKWDVSFTSVKLTDGSIGTVPSHTTNTVTYTVDLTEGSTYEFDAVITNAGTYNALLKTLTVSDIPEALDGLVTYEVTGVTAGTTNIAGNGGTATVHVKVTMDTVDTTEELTAVQNNPTLTLTILAEFEQV